MMYSYNHIGDISQPRADDNEYLPCLLYESVQPLSHIITGSPQESQSLQLNQLVPL